MKPSVVLENSMKAVLRAQKDSSVFIFIQFSATPLPSNKSAN